MNGIVQHSESMCKSQQLSPQENNRSCELKDLVWLSGIFKGRGSIYLLKSIKARLSSATSFPSLPFLYSMNTTVLPSTLMRAEWKSYQWEGSCKLHHGRSHPQVLPCPEPSKFIEMTPGMKILFALTQGALNMVCQSCS